MVRLNNGMKLFEVLPEKMDLKTFLEGREGLCRPYVAGWLGPPSKKHTAKTCFHAVDG